MRKLYCYDGPRGTDPHAIIIELNDPDALRWEQAKEHRVSVVVTDQATHKYWIVSSAPCGASCHCAAMAVRYST